MNSGVVPIDSRRPKSENANEDKRPLNEGSGRVTIYTSYSGLAFEARPRGLLP
jgi:hypothetical protein